MNLSYRESLKMIHDRLYIYSPPSLLPFARFNEIIHRINSHLLLLRIREWRKKLSTDDLVLGFSFPFYYKDILKGLDYLVSYYDVCDDYILFPSLPFNREKLRRLEEQLLKSVDVVFCSSRGLKEKSSLFNKNCFLIPNGVDFTLFEKTPSKEPSDLKGIPKPIIGYMGTLGEWVDEELLRELSLKRKKWSFVFIGPITSKKFLGLKNISNIYFLGEKKYEQIPNYLSFFDICTIPFKVNEFTQMVCPTKFYQYLAAGKPIVSSPLRDLEEFKEFIEFYTNVSEMEEKIEKLLKDERVENFHKRKEVAKDNLWEKRVERITEIIKSKLKTVKDSISLCPMESHRR
ncbi:MAG: glycosyltransferase [Thermodesulfobacteriota bacterium]